MNRDDYFHSEEHRDLLDLDSDVESIEVIAVLTEYRYNWGRIESVVTKEGEVVRRIRNRDGSYIYQFSD